MPAYRFIIVLFSQHHQFIIIRQTMGMMGQIPATDTDRMYFRHIFGHSHQIRHRPERFTGIIHIQPSDYYADTVICQCFTYRHYIRIKKLGFNRRINSSVLPENIEPQTTSIQPARLVLSKNIPDSFLVVQKYKIKGFRDGSFCQNLPASAKLPE